MQNGTEVDEVVTVGNGVEITSQIGKDRVEDCVFNGGEKGSEGRGTLDKIANKVGYPIRTDQMTASKERISYARVLVDIDTTKDIVEEVEIKAPGGVMITQKVYYEWTSIKYGKCQFWDHKTEVCRATVPPVAPNQVWKVKKAPEKEVQVPVDKITTPPNEGFATMSGRRSAPRRILVDDEASAPQPLIQGSRFTSLRAWNVRGLNRLEKHREIRSVLTQNKLCFVGCLETRVKPSKFQKIVSSCFRNWGWLNNYYYANNSRNWCIWDKEKVDVEFIKASDQFLHVLVTGVAFEFEAMVTLVHAWNTEAQRWTLWRDLISIADTCQLPWIALRNFHTFLSYEEKIGYHGVPIEPCEESAECVLEAGLEDLRGAMGNHFWFKKYGDEEDVIFQSSGLSDICRMVVHLGDVIYEGPLVSDARSELRKRPFLSQDFKKALGEIDDARVPGPRGKVLETTLQEKAIVDQRLDARRQTTPRRRLQLGSAFADFYKDGRQTDQTLVSIHAAKLNGVLDVYKRRLSKSRSGEGPLGQITSPKLHAHKTQLSPDQPNPAQPIRFIHQPLNPSFPSELPKSSIGASQLARTHPPISSICVRSLASGIGEKLTGIRLLDMCEWKCGAVWDGGVDFGVSLFRWYVLICGWRLGLVLILDDMPAIHGRGYDLCTHAGHRVCCSALPIFNCSWILGISF
ncbi:hypothetical protein AKJ16_DCAP14614 [Drosera capensis]